MPNSTLSAQDERRALADRSSFISESVRAVVARRRQELGLSLQQLADRSSLTKAHVWEVEQGRSKNVCVSTIVGLAAGLSICEAELLGLAALRAEPARGGEEMRPAIHAWIRDDVPLAGKMNLMSKHVDALIAKLRALPASQPNQGGEDEPS